MAIEQGIQYLQHMGADHICKVCIHRGGSCCTGCRHLTNGIGCQLRNISCTAWLCGFLKYVLYEMGVLQEWNDFWDQIPGQDFRQDFTPAYIRIRQPLLSYNIEALSLALAADLEEIARTNVGMNFVALRERIDKNISLIHKQKYPKKRMKYVRNIQIISKPFRQFKAALADMRAHGITEVLVSDSQNKY
jgi:hypothetical protein